MTEQGGTSRPAKKPRTRRRRLLLAVVVAVVLLVVLTALLPTLAGTRWGTNIVQWYVNGTMAGSVRIDQLDVAWSKGQHVTGLTLFDPDGAVALTVEKIAAPDLSLWAMLRGGGQFGRINAQNARGRIDQLMRATNKPNAASAADDAQPGDVGRPIETVEIAVPNAEFDIPDPGRIKAKFQSHLTLIRPDSGDHQPLKGTVDVDCTVHQLFDEQWQLQWHQFCFC